MQYKKAANWAAGIFLAGLLSVYPEWSVIWNLIS